MSEMNRSKKSGSSVAKEVERLFRDNPKQIPQSVMYKLREKYGDQAILDRIQDEFVESRRRIQKKAKKLARKILERYGSQNYPLHILLKKALKYKRKMNLSDAQFQEFRRIYEREITGDHSQTDKLKWEHPYTTMSQTLGLPTTDLNDGLGHLSSKEMKHVQEILKMEAENSPLHASVVLQSLSYESIPYEAIAGQYDSTKHNPFQSISPIVAALFLPKFPVLEEHMLRASIGHIVKQKYNKEPIVTKDDYELYYDLVSDPTDVVCDESSPMKDLCHRVQVQCALWKDVLSLRNGRYFTNNNELKHALNNCRRNNYANPDANVYVQDEGNQMQKLMACFSLRPTIVATTPMFNTANAGPMVVNHVAPTISSIPMVTFRLPPLTSLGNNQVGELKLSDAINQHQFYVEDGKIMPKQQNLLYSRGLLMFYVPRRSHTLNLATVAKPYRFNRMPVSISGFERINDRCVSFEDQISVGNGGRGSTEDTFQLRSVVLLETRNDLLNHRSSKARLITGNSCVVIKRENEYNSRYGDTKVFGEGQNAMYYHYYPQRSGVGFHNSHGIASYNSAVSPHMNRQFLGQGDDNEKTTPRPLQYVKTQPVHVLVGDHGKSDATSESFKNMAESRGTVFVYEVYGPQQGRIEQTLAY